MSEVETARLILDKALADLRALAGMLDSTIFDDEIFGFHAQQAVEKSLKAWIALSDVEYPLTHDISRLLTILQDLGKDIDAFWPLVDLNIFAVQFRYPSEDYPIEPIDRPVTIERVRELTDLVGELLKKTQD